MKGLSATAKASLCKLLSSSSLNGLGPSTIGSTASPVSCWIASMYVSKDSYCSFSNSSSASGPSHSLMNLRVNGDILLGWPGLKMKWTIRRSALSIKRDFSRRVCFAIMEDLMRDFSLPNASNCYPTMPSRSEPEWPNFWVSTRTELSS